MDDVGDHLPRRRCRTATATDGRPCRDRRPRRLLDADRGRDAVPRHPGRERARPVDVARRRAVHGGVRRLRHGPRRRRHGRLLVVLGRARDRHPDRDRRARDHGLDHARGPARPAGVAGITGDGDRHVRRVARQRPGRRPPRGHLRPGRPGRRRRRLPGRAGAHRACRRSRRDRLAVDLLRDERLQQRRLRPGRPRAGVHRVREPAPDAAHDRRPDRDRRPRLRHRRRPGQAPTLAAAGRRDQARGRRDRRPHRRRSGRPGPGRVDEPPDPGAARADRQARELAVRLDHAAERRLRVPGHAGHAARSPTRSRRS